MKKAENNKGRPTAETSAKGAVPLWMLQQNFGTPNLDVSTDPDLWQKKLFIFTPTTGLVRAEWVQARYAQIIPTNWSYVEMMQFLSPYVPVHYQLADAENLMAKQVVEGNYEWVLTIEHDNLLPPDAFFRMNQYMQSKEAPMVSGLYFLKSDMTEPLLYRRQGSGPFLDWKLGDKVWVDGIPFGFQLMHASLIKAAWDESEEYQVGGVTTRRVFEQPGSSYFDEAKGGVVNTGGTTDLNWCKRIKRDNLFEKAGWTEFKDREFPYLVDTNIFVKHIDQNGVVYPINMPARHIPEDGYEPVEIV